MTGETLLVTGGAGFVGSHTVRELVDREVVGVPDPAMVQVVRPCLRGGLTPVDVRDPAVEGVGDRLEGEQLSRRGGKAFLPAALGALARGVGRGGWTMLLGREPRGRGGEKERG